jgi:hypothetical protein
MPERETRRRVQRDKAKHKARSTQAGEFIREEIHHVREGKHGARSAQQAIAIGLSKARRGGRRPSERSAAAQKAARTKGPARRTAAAKKAARSSTRHHGRREDQRKVPSTKPSRAPSRKWSKRVTESSDALDLEPGAFKGSPKEVAISLKRSADRSRRRKADSFRSAMSMLTFYMNRAGTRLSAATRRGLDAAKEELRVVYGRAQSGSPSRRRSATD